MTEKIILNVVYSPQTDAPHKVFENEDGEVWNSKERDSKKINIGMGWYSIRDPKPNSGDCILVVEPYCILDRDYRTNFVNKFDKVFTWATRAFNDPNLTTPIIEINLPSYQTYPSAKEASQSWKKWDERAEEIIFIANNKTASHHSELYSLRIQLADLFHQSNDYKVSWYGQIPLEKPYFKGKASDKKEVLEKAKFSICTENSYDKKYSYGYFSEKLPDVWKAGTVPLYMGCYNVDNFDFFKNSYIDLRKYVKKEDGKFQIDKDGILSEMKSFNSQKYNSWAERIKLEIIDNSKYRDLILFKKPYETMIKSFKK